MVSMKRSPAEERRYWQQHIEQWSRSGRRTKTYCERAGLCIQQFGAWRQRLKREGWRPSESEAATMIALEVRSPVKSAATTPARTTPITVRLGSGLGVEVNAGLDAATLRAVVKALGSSHVRA